MSPPDLEALARELGPDYGLRRPELPQPRDGTSLTHDRDELYFVASGRGFYRADDKVTPVRAGDLCLAAAGRVHGFEKFTKKFAIWIIFYGDEAEARRF